MSERYISYRSLSHHCSGNRECPWASARSLPSLFSHSSISCSANALDIRRQTANELKAGGDANQRLLAGQIGRTSVQFNVNHAQPQPPSSAPPIPPPPSAASAISDRLQVHHHAPLTPNLSTASLSTHHSHGHGHDGSAAVVEPVDYEEFIGGGGGGQGRAGERDSTAHLLEFPRDDIDVKVVPRKIRTMGHVLPEEAKDYLDPSVQNCVDCYTSDYVVVRRKHHHFSSSVVCPVDSFEEERRRVVVSVAPQEYEVDDTPDVSPEYEHVSSHLR